MKTQIRRIGNSLGSTIPAHLIKELGLSEGSQIEVIREDNKIVLVPTCVTRLPKFTESELLQGLSAHNSHADELATVNQYHNCRFQWRQITVLASQYSAHQLLSA